VPDAARLPIAWQELHRGGSSPGVGAMAGPAAAVSPADATAGPAGPTPATANGPVGPAPATANGSAGRGASHD
jgi:hypothetical protein